MMILIVYFDVVVTGNDIEMITRLKRQLHRMFDIKDLGLLQYILGWKFLAQKENLSILKKVCS